MGITFDIGTSMIKLKESLTTKRNGDLKELIIKYPNTNISTYLKNKRFKLTCTSHSISEKRMKANSDLYTNESITFLLLYETMEETTAIGDSTLNLPLKDFKKNSALIYYEGKKYEIKEEEVSSFDVGTHLYCTNTD